MDPPPSEPHGPGISRRRFLAMMGAMAGAGAFALANTQCAPDVLRRVVQGTRAVAPPQHAVWVWQFSIDGPVAEIAPALAARNLAVVVKTHDGLDWMATYDPVPGAVAGAREAGILARVFEDYGVPFHAWAVVKGIDPVREAAMAADVLDAGAHSLTLDLEAHEGFWAGTSDDALRFGEELRRRNPYGRVDVAIDPRPWQMLAAPLGEFATFCDGIRPQLYWDIYDTPDNANGYAYLGFPPGPAGITPEFLVDTTRRLLAPFDRWVVPLALGTARDAAWARFAHEAWAQGMPALNVWRYGTAGRALLDYLGANPPGAEPAGEPG
ncbi:MAG TPA: twin-arginine translocation signal domain-containing protein [Dehalococcoidia bacterium]|nr:twin-arginine translocation signal domain-containing protein [Dehalococcoidia bacterium]